MTYTNVHLLLEGDATMRERYQPLVERFELMQELALVLNKKRVRRGSIDFDLPEPLIEFDDWRHDRRHARAAQYRQPHHRGVHAGGQRERRRTPGTCGIASVYRIHEMPDPKRVMEFEEIATHFGVSLGIGAIP